MIALQNLLLYSDFLALFQQLHNQHSAGFQTDDVGQ